VNCERIVTRVAVTVREAGRELQVERLRIERLLDRELDHRDLDGAVLHGELDRVNLLRAAVDIEVRPAPGSRRDRRVATQGGVEITQTDRMLQRIDGRIGIVDRVGQLLCCRGVAAGRSRILLGQLSGARFALDTAQRPLGKQFTCHAPAFG
jgi:hypothetical protein